MNIFNLIFSMLILSIFSEEFNCNFKFKKIYENIDFSINSTIIISCIPKYKVEPELCKEPISMTWKHNSSVVKDTENRRRLISSNYELVIFYAQYSDAGTYVCDANNDYGQINKTFTFRKIESNQFYSSIAKNLLPHSTAEEKKGHIYWLPEMLNNFVQQNNVRNKGEEIVFLGAYYLSDRNEHVDSFKVEWFYQLEGSDTITKLMDDDTYKQITYEKSCGNHSLIPRNVSGKCFFNKLYISNIGNEEQRFYHSVAKLDKAFLNLTYLLRINTVNIAVPEGEAHMDYHFDTKVCFNDYFELKCRMTSNDLYVAIHRVNKNGSETLVAEVQLESLNIMNGENVVSNGQLIPSSEVTHIISPVTFSDAGIYACMAIPISQMVDKSNRGGSYIRKVMNLTVISCTAPAKESQISSWHNVIIWPLVTISVVTFVLALAIYSYHYYTTSCLVKTVIIQHPNKLYVPHDTACPLLLPQVSIRTSHRFRRQYDFRSDHKQLNRISVIPFSQKLTKYFQKSCIFNYRRVNASGSSPIVETIRLSDANSSKSSSNSTKEDNKSQELIVENNSRIQYKLPANIGWVFNRDSLIVGSKIGEGAFGIVYDGVAKVFTPGSVSVEVAVKTLHDSFGDEDLINLVKEMEMLKLIGHHRHIIALYGAYIDNGHPYMVMELAKNGNLRDFLRSQRNHTNALHLQKCLELNVSTLTLIDLHRFGKEIAAGMEFLSSKRIIHRDLAARNILVDQHFEMKIADFGLTRAVESYYRKSTDGRLPIKWMAPECLLDRVYTVKSDVWSFGIVLWEIFTMGQTPYPTILPDSMHQALRNGLRNEKPDLATDEIYNVMLNIWNDDPVERPMFSELVTKMSLLQFQQVAMSSRVDCGSTPSVDQEPSQDTLIKNYLELHSTQYFSTTVV